MKNLRIWIALAILGAADGAHPPLPPRKLREPGQHFMIGGSTSPVILPDVAYDHAPRSLSGGSG